MSRQSALAARSDFWARMPLGARLTFLFAVFFMFAPLGVLGISSLAPQRPWVFYAVYALFSGLTGAGFAYSFSQNRRFLWVVGPSQLLWAQLYQWVPGASAALSFEGLGTVALIAAGYAFFIKFIAGEGSRRLRLETEMRLAQEIHTSLIPPVARNTSQLELFGQSLSSSEMGGDLLDVVESGDQWGVYIADVSGHGVKAGVVMGMIKSAMRMRLRHTHSLDELLRDLNHVTCELAGSGMFVTCACLRFAADGTAQFAGAGHGAILHFRATDRSLHALESEHLPLGILPDESYRARTISAAVGDVFLLMTDGLTEVFDSKDRLLGQGPIEALLLNHATLPLKEIYELIMDAVCRHGPRSDDQTLMLVRIRRDSGHVAHP